MSKRQNMWAIFSNFAAFSQYLNFNKLAPLYVPNFQYFRKQISVLQDKENPVVLTCHLPLLQSII